MIKHISIHCTFHHIVIKKQGCSHDTPIAEWCFSFASSLTLLDGYPWREYPNFLIASFHLHPVSSKKTNMLLLYIETSAWYCACNLSDLCSATNCIFFLESPFLFRLLCCGNTRFCTCYFMQLILNLMKMNRWMFTTPFQSIAAHHAHEGHGLDWWLYSESHNQYIQICPGFSRQLKLQLIHRSVANVYLWWFYL